MKCLSLSTPFHFRYHNLIKWLFCSALCFRYTNSKQKVCHCSALSTHYYFRYHKYFENGGWTGTEHYTSIMHDRQRLTLKISKKFNRIKMHRLTAYFLKGLTIPSFRSYLELASQCLLYVDAGCIQLPVFTQNCWYLLPIQVILYLNYDYTNFTWHLCSDVTTHNRRYHQIIGFHHHHKITVKSQNFYGDLLRIFF